MAEGRNDIEPEADQRRYGGPYTSKHPIPTVQGYREHCAELRQEELGERVAEQEQATEALPESVESSKFKHAYGSVENMVGAEYKQKESDAYPTANWNLADGPNEDRSAEDSNRGDAHADKSCAERGGYRDEAVQEVASLMEPKEKRKAMKKHKPKGGERDVTDPITHVPITVHDMTESDLKAAPENESPPGTTLRKGASKTVEQLAQEEGELGRVHAGMRSVLPRADFGDVKMELMDKFRTAALAGLGVILGFLMLERVVGMLVGSPSDDRGLGRRGAGSIAGLFCVAVAGYAVILAVTGWLAKKVDQAFEDKVWNAAFEEQERVDQAEVPESAEWLNKVLASVWPLINPDLFSSLADTLEDVMQASLPRVVRMVSIEDIGQGSEAARVVGIRWLPTDAASECVVDATTISEDMEADEGDFVNMELAFTYRVKSSGVKSKARNAHLSLKFYLPGGIAMPVWVKVRAVVGIMRVRLQLTPDPPFFRLCTMTFIGQPRAHISCSPLSRHSPNIMDLPLMSSFVQSSIDAALAEYVAPKSLTLDLRDMMLGDDFKKDTMARGVVVVLIKYARGFKAGDGGMGPLKGSSDGYVTVAWGKFGKPVASTRVIVDSQTPTWNEWATVLVTPEEINADETLRMQLWDSDKYTADDDLGRVEVPLRDLMHGSRTRNRMCDREDEFRGEEAGESMPGTLTWSVGYFAKARIQPCQLEKQTVDADIRTTKDLESWAASTAKSKLREAAHESQDPREQTLQDLSSREDEMMVSTPPPDHLRSGIFSIQIHNITGLQISRPNRRPNGQLPMREDEAEQLDSLPSSYCEIILNQRQIYRTRTKPKNAKPFFNAGTERFVRDWAAAEVVVSVRDSRQHEHDPLLGIVYLPLRRVFEHRSQVVQSFPLAGGIGHGRARISLVWRSVELRLPMELRGWDVGTVEVSAPIRLKGTTSTTSGQDAWKSCKIRLLTKVAKAKMYADATQGEWRPRRKGSVFLGVVERYAEPLLLEFRQKALVTHASPSLAVVWLDQVVDEEEKTLTLPVWQGGKDNLKLARTCADYASYKRDAEEPIGEIELTLRFWRGLSGFHRSWTHKAANKHVGHVMEVLDTINDENMGEHVEIDHVDSASSSLSSSGSDDDDEDDEEDVESGGRLSGRLKRQKHATQEDDDHDGQRGALAQIRDYRRHADQLHRKHRGVMQWKAARTLDWMVSKVGRVKGKVGDVFEHGEKGRGVETEVGR